MDSRRSRTAARSAVTVLFSTLALQAAAPLAIPGEVRAEDTILTIAKDSVYGAATGLLLGGVLALVVDEDNRGDSIRWGVVVGTFAGCAFGIWQVARPDDFSLQPPAIVEPLAIVEQPRTERRIGEGAARPRFTAEALRASGHAGGKGIGER